MDYNLGVSGWKRIFDRLGFLTRLWKEADDFWKRLTGNSYKVVEYNDVDGQLDDWDLDGVQFDTNTDEAGKIYVSLDEPVAGDYRVRLYKDSGKTSLVASGQRTGNGTITLTEQNNSGLSGSVDVTWTAATEDIYLVIEVDYLKRLQWLTPEDKAEDNFLALARDVVETLQSDVAGLKSTIESAMNTFLSSYFAEKIESTRTTVQSQDIDEDSAGNTTVEYEGIAGEFRDGMLDDSGSPTLSQESFSTSVEFDEDNQGKGSLSITLENGCRVERLWLTCTDETLGSESFEVKGRLDDETIVTAETDLEVEKTFKSPALGIKSMKIDRTIVDSGAGAGYFSNWVINGESAANTDDGKLYCSWNQANKELKLYKDSGKADADLVASGTIASLPGTLNFSGSTLSGSVDMTDPGSDTTVDVDLQPFKENDRVRVTITLPTTKNYFHGVFARIMKTPLPDSASPNIPADFATRG